MTLSKTAWLTIGAIMLVSFAAQLRGADFHVLAVVCAAFVMAFDC